MGRDFRYGYGHTVDCKPKAINSNYMDKFHTYQNGSQHNLHFQTIHLGRKIPGPAVGPGRHHHVGDEARRLGERGVGVGEGPQADVEPDDDGVAVRLLRLREGGVVQGVDESPQVTAVAVV